MPRPSAPVHDLRIRLLVSPLLGVLIPTLSGLVTPARYGLPGLAGTFGYFSLVALTIWTGNESIIS